MRFNQKSKLFIETQLRECSKCHLETKRFVVDLDIIVCKKCQESSYSSFTTDKTPLTKKFECPYCNSFDLDKEKEISEKISEISLLEFLRESKDSDL